VVAVKEDYDHAAFSPLTDTCWDTSFAADLEAGSNVSYAHLPLSGKRGREQWRDTRNSEFILLGSRGPKDGRLDRFSYTLGPDGTWRGHAIFADGHIELFNDVVPEGGALDASGTIVPDNLFIDQGPDPYVGGYDMFITFTSEVLPASPVFQWD
jgi:hypothetical protein